MLRFLSDHRGQALLTGALTGLGLLLGSQVAQGAATDLGGSGETLTSNSSSDQDADTNSNGLVTAGESPVASGGLFIRAGDRRDEQVRAEADAPGADRYVTGELEKGWAVPMQDFRVGPLFGRVGGPHSGGVHSGLDLGANANTPVRAITGGKVEVAGWQGAAGQAVTILTKDGKRILYGHLNRTDVKQGDNVSAGQRIGLVGSTGNSTGPHLHIGVTKKDGSLMDPLRWMGIEAKDLKKFGRD